MDSLAHALSGAGGGVISMLLTYPLNNVSSRLQIQHNTGTKTYQSTYDAIKKIVSKEGVFGLYSGLDSALLGIALNNGVYYYFYEFAKSGLEKASGSRSRQVSPFRDILANAIAGIATVVITNPIWTRMATGRQSLDEDEDVDTKNDSTNLNVFQALYAIFQEDGPLALWQGIVPSLVLVVNPTIQNTLFEQSKQLLNINGAQPQNSFHYFWLGAVSKLVATALTYPYLVVKTRMQLRQSNSDESIRYETLYDSLKKIIKREGIQGLYKGIASKLLQSMLSAAIVATVKEGLFQYTLQLLYTLRGTKGLTGGFNRGHYSQGSYGQSNGKGSGLFGNKVFQKYQQNHSTTIKVKKGQL